MKICFVMPSVGRKEGVPYVRSWQMEPLMFAVLNALTPKEHERIFFDDRMEEVDTSVDCDLVVITVETYTARRAYQLSTEFRKRGKTVIMGGYHTTLVPEEVSHYANAILIGDAESLWPTILKDFENGKLQSRYEHEEAPSLKKVLPDRSIYKDQNYVPLTLIEGGRGCNFKCDFCSITSFHKATHRTRDIESIIKEIREDARKVVFLIDDNIGATPAFSKELFDAMKGLKKKWVSQISINMATDRELVKSMKESGCLGVLIGFESLDTRNLTSMQKQSNLIDDVYDRGLKNLHDFGILVYGTFLFGYDYDTRESFDQTLAFIEKHKLFLAAFNHVVPFPGTDLYEKLKAEGRLRYDKWWLSEEVGFGEVYYEPKNFAHDELSRLCEEYRHKFYSIKGMAKRFFDWKLYLSSPLNMSLFLTQNFAGRGEVSQRMHLPLGTPGQAILTNEEIAHS